MSFIPFRNNPSQQIIDFAAQKLLSSGARGNILAVGATNGKNAKYLIENYLKKWNNPKYKFYIVDDFADEFGDERRDEFVANTRGVRDWVVHYKTNEFDHLLNKRYALVMFREPSDAIRTHGEAQLLWPNVVPGGYFYFLNYSKDEYDMNFGKSPSAGIDFFFEGWKDVSPDWGMKPHPYIQKGMPIFSHHK